MDTTSCIGDPPIPGYICWKRTLAGLSWAVEKLLFTRTGGNLWTRRHSGEWVWT